MGYNSRRNLIDIIENLTRDNESLRVENDSLRKENTELRLEIARLTGLAEGKIMEAVERQTAPLRAKIVELETEIADKDLEIQKFKVIINKDSSNSSKPPGTDGFKRIPNNREKSARKQGGQTGHSGRSLEVPENLDKLVEDGKAVKKLVDYTNGSDDYISKWIIDIDIKPVYTEVRYPSATQLPPELTPEVVYGSAVKSLSILLEHEGVVAIKRMTDLFSTITGGLVSPSKGTIESFFSKFSSCLDEDIAMIKKELKVGRVINTDDTPMRCAETMVYDKDGIAVSKIADKTSFKVNVRTYSNEKVTLLTVNPMKDDDGIIRDGVLLDFDGILGHDHDIKFYKYSFLNATCCEHLARVLKGLCDLYHIQWADSFRSFLYEMNAYKKMDLCNGVNRCNNVALKKFLKRYDSLVAAGDLLFFKMAPNDFGYVEFRRILARLRDYKDAYTLFIRDYSAPFTNNLAERDLRSCKTRQKISGCFRTWTGISEFVKAKSVISTWKKQGLDLFSKISGKFIVQHFMFDPSGQ